MLPKFRITDAEARRRLTHRWLYELARNEDIVAVFPLSALLNRETITVVWQFNLYRWYSVPRHQEVWRAAWKEAWQERRRRELLEKWKASPVGSC
jgi:hypothetical protein